MMPAILLLAGAGILREYRKKLKNMVLTKSFLILISILILSIFTGCTEKTPKPIIAFESISDISNGLKNPTEVAKSALEKKYGENWFESYQIDGTVKYPSILYDHVFVKIPSTNPPYFFPNFSLLFTSEKTYILSPQDFNKFIETYGSSIKIEKNETILQLIDNYLKLYGAREESIFTEGDLREWTEEKKNKYNVDPKKFSDLNIIKEEPYYRVHIYTDFMVNSSSIVPSPIDLIVSEYDAKIGSKGEVFLTLINRSIYEQFEPAGPR